MTHCSQGRKTRSGVYNFDLSNNIFLVFIGDFNDVDKSRSFFQGTAHSDIGMQLTELYSHMKKPDTKN